MARIIDEIEIYDEAEGIIVQGRALDGTIPTTAGRFAPGCTLLGVDGNTYRNTGTTAAPVWDNADSIATSEIAAGAVTYAKRSSVVAVTATSDGLTTGLITDGSTFVTVTSDSATKFVTLPVITSAGIGQTVDIYVAGTGYELVTPVSSNNTINTVDADQTNQLDVAANTLLRCVQITATGWAAYQVAATTITVVAPDND